MAHEAQNVQLAGVVVNGGNQAVMVASDVKNNHGSAAGHFDFIRRSEDRSYFGQMLPVGRLGYAQSPYLRHFGPRIVAGYFTNGRGLDDPHAYITRSFGEKST